MASRGRGALFLGNCERKFGCSLPIKKTLFLNANLKPVANSVDDLRTKSKSATGNYHYLLRQDREVLDLSKTQLLMCVFELDTLSLLLSTC